MSWPCPSPASFSILVVYELHDLVLQLSGDLERRDVDALDECVVAALAEGPRRLVLEMSSLMSVEASTVASLRAALEQAEASGVHLILDSPNQDVCAVLDAAGSRGDFSIR